MTQRKNCTECGRFIRTRARVQCVYCRGEHKDPFVFDEKDLAYTGGWIRHGQILVPDTPGGRK